MKEKKKRVFVSWSGGKESCLACYKALKSGFKVTRLLNFLAEDGKRERAHGLRSSLLRLQSEAVGIPIFQVNASWEGYESKFKQAVAELKKDGRGKEGKEGKEGVGVEAGGVGVEAGVFGDIDLAEHREWVERVCSELEIEPILPLWGLKPEAALREFVEAGFEAVVVATRVREEWLGRRVDESFIEELRQFDFHLCGESGEYHTFVVDGPIFKRRVKLGEGDAERREVGENWFLDIKEAELE